MNVSPMPVSFVEIVALDVFTLTGLARGALGDKALWARKVNAT